MLKSIISLVALSTIGLMTFPALADNANVQTSGQVNTQVGDRNSSSQNTSQSNLNSRRGPSGENTGSAQDSYQDSYQEGFGNRNEQDTVQRNVDRRHR
ncbi:hypothetical protein VB715_14075 [Crocosphaera sp. UHCC 0190]|uniref:hypothetical protein n=1 Tax=Crocosphaera sp. UHCC 0190 TaxID=3110246 RepID=UPI002B21881D|nr:hypothetical protein [Crocosphaera sp. UHCC 0190]MEA5510897.1 hypothetical protein [Crocosphaera sp. UHCC 0190]